ncbi:MAG TPA: hypothetical protein VFL77_02695 [Solirubrobacterales bacterium]|nr:hypothetical protein [Solirubrobacterales bacterium]
MPKAPFTFLLAALCGLCIVSAAQADPAEYAGSSVDGSKAFFTTTAKLVPGDTDNGFSDVYERFYTESEGATTYFTREISTSPTGGSDAYNVTYDGASEDGTKVFFSTAEVLVPADKDRSTDIYMRNTATGETVLVSQGAASCAPACGNEAFPANFVGATPTGSKVFFTTNEQLAEGDSDEAGDVYVRDLSTAPATTALVSRPDPSCSGCEAAAAATVPVNDGRPAISADGNSVVFLSTDKLAEGDGDNEADYYERNFTAGTTELVSPEGTCPEPLTAGECAPLYRGISAEGKVFLQTKARLLSGEDVDSSQDVYQWSPGGALALVSTSAEGEKGEGSFNANFAGSSPDGSAVLFTTQEPLASADSGTQTDVYERAGGVTKLVSPGSEAFSAKFDAVSTDGATVLFSTAQPLSGDAGEKQDVYSWSGGTTSLVSAGSAEYDSTFARASADAARVFYTTAAPLVSADKDEKPDIYVAGETPTLISTGPVGGNGLDTPHLAAISSDGGHAFFTTTERLTVDDNFAGEQDVYEHSAGGTLLVSVGNPGELELGPPAPGLTGTNPPSPGSSLEPAVLGEAEPGAAISLFATSDCHGAPVAVGTAVEAGEPGAGTFSIAVSVEPGSTTSFHAKATNAGGDTSACSSGLSGSVTYKQESAPPPGGEGGGGGGTGEGGGGSGGEGGSGGSTGGGSGSAGGSTGSTGGAGGPSGGSGEAIKIGGVVYVAPLTRITFGPAAKTRARRPVFRFADSVEQPGTTFICKVDRRSWKGCSSPFKLPRLKPGRHVFEVKGKSAAGQWEQKPVKRVFTVVRRKRR